MNRYTRTLLALAAVVLLAACAPTADEPSSTPAAPMSSMGSMSMAPMTSASPSAMGSHEMDEMGGGSGETAAVEITNFAFDPAELTISAGTEVTFTNVDPAPHTVTAGTDDDPMTDLFDSGLLEQGESFTFVFDEPGTTAYFCDRHPPMEGSITVEG